MAEDVIVVYGTQWCGDCWRSKQFLDKHRVPYRWIDIGENEEAQDFVIKVNRGMRSVPTIVFPDGAILVEPSNEELGKKLGLSRKASL